MHASEQLTKFLARVPDDVGPDEQLDYLAPKVVIPSALQLDRDQEIALVEHVCDEIHSLSMDQGRDATLNEDWYRGLSPTDFQDSLVNLEFLAKRELYDLYYHTNVDWRAYTYGGLFAKTNMHVPIGRRLLQQMIARANGYFFGTDPWFALLGVGPEDDDTAKVIERWTQWGFRKAKARQAFELAVQHAFVRGEGVLKTTYRREMDYYEAFEEIAINPESGEPLVANDGDFIYRHEDKWIPDPSGMLDEAEAELSGDPGAVERLRSMMESPEPPPMVLERDPTTEHPHPGQEFTYDSRRVSRQKERYAGLDLANVYFKDFLISRYARDIESASSVIHLMDVSAVDVAHRYLDQAREQGGDDNMPRMIEMLREMATNGPDGHAALDQPRATLGETRMDDQSFHSHESRLDPTIKLAEAYVHFDANNDGRQESLVVVVDVQNKTPIFYDYLSNVTPDGKRPFHCVRVNPVDGRWHGISQLEIFLPLNESIDTFLNRINHGQSSEGSVDVVNRDVVEEGARPGKININDGGVFHLRPGKTAEDFLTRIQLVDVKTDHLRDLIEFLLQVMQNMSGVTNANDAHMAGMDTAKLATGIKHLDRTGQELFAPFLSQLADGLESATSSAIRLMMANMKERETFRFFDGTQYQLEELLQQDIHGFDYDVELTLSRYHAEQELAQATAAIEVVKDYGNLPTPSHLKALRPAYLSALKSYQMRNPDMVLDGVAQGALDLMQMGMQGEGAGATPAPKPAATMERERETEATV